MTWFLMDNQFGIYSQQINDCYTHCMSPMSSSEMLCGSPYGGCSILWKKNLASSVSPLGTDSNSAIALTMNNVSFLLCNVYLIQVLFVKEYRSVLPEVLPSILSNNCIIIGGDFNTDFKREGSNVTLLKSLTDSKSLRVALRHEVNNVLFTFDSKTFEKEKPLKVIYTSPIWIIFWLMSLYCNM